MRVMMERLSRRQPGESRYPEALERLAQVLKEQEVEPAHVETLIEGVMAQWPAGHADSDDELAREMLKAEIRKRWSQERVEGIRPDSKIVHFVGPTGVGKTTTIAKLAAEQVLKHRRKVGFITSDTYRIAAVEQLRTYATILNVPLEVVFSPHEMTRAFAQLKDREIIFMDTAGRNFRNEMYVSELNSLLSGSGPSETYLVLSMTTRYRDMKAIVENFSRFRLDKLLFTKGDETDTYGALLNMAMDYPLTFSYITDGQNVPDDISLIHVETWIDRIVGGGGHA
jgi:flagellar biosynthesis protein FlhF